jgi:hypothetical protein
MYRVQILNIQCYHNQCELMGILKRLRERFFPNLLAAIDADDDAIIPNLVHREDDIAYTKKQWTQCVEIFRNVLTLNVIQDMNRMRTDNSFSENTRNILLSIDISQTVYGKEYLKVFDKVHVNEILDLSSKRLMWKAFDVKEPALRNMIPLSVGYAIARVLDITENIKYPELIIFPTMSDSIYKSGNMLYNSIRPCNLSSLDIINGNISEALDPLRGFIDSSMVTPESLIKCFWKYHETLADDYICLNVDGTNYFNDEMLDILRTPELTWLINNVNEKTFSSKQLTLCSNITPFRLWYFIQHYARPKRLLIDRTKANAPIISIEI